jgi:hypothetical protein
MGNRVGDGNKEVVLDIRNDQTKSPVLALRNARAALFGM